MANAQKVHKFAGIRALIEEAVLKCASALCAVDCPNWTRCRWYRATFEELEGGSGVAVKCPFCGNVFDLEIWPDDVEDGRVAVALRCPECGKYFAWRPDEGR